MSAEPERRADLVAALREAIEVLELCDPEGEGAKHIHAPEDPMILDLCERIGYGAVINSAARQWWLKDPSGAQTNGPCAGTVRKILSQLRSALAALDSPAEAPDALPAAFRALLAVADDVLQELWGHGWFCEVTLRQAIEDARKAFARPAVGAPAEAGLREKECCRVGFIHGATWAGRSLKSAKRAADQRYPEAAPAPSAQAPASWKLPLCQMTDSELHGRDAPESAKRVWRCKGCGKVVGAGEREKDQDGVDCHRDWTVNDLCGPVEEVQP